MLKLEHFRHIVPDSTLAEIYARARGLYGKHVVHVNSTYTGGGVAAILESLVPLMNDVGLDAGWRILHGTMEFFDVTKEFHNGLQGKKMSLTERKKRLYVEVNENFGRFTHLDHDCIIVHDPQPLPLIGSYKKRQPWIWRCHIDLTEPQPELWEYLKAWLLKYDQIVVSDEAYFKSDLPVDQRLLRPAINPLTTKNKDLPEETIAKRLEQANVPTDKPLLTQVSRLDPWKDPEGVLDVYAMVKKEIDCRLVFCYNVATDDPEALRVYDRVYQKARRIAKPDEVLFVVGNSDELVNALQRASAVILQKSTREGFCLAVTEALWKKKVVVASNVGGIPSQIRDGETGFLVEPKDTATFAEKILYVLEHPDEARAMGEAAREDVREKFLVPRLLSDYLDMLNAIVGNSKV